MNDFYDFSSQIEGDIARYERYLAEAKKVARLPGPDGFEHATPVPIIEAVLTELGRLRSLHSPRRRQARKARLNCAE